MPRGFSIRAGLHYPPGAVADANGVNFSIASLASVVAELRLYEGPQSTDPFQVIRLGPEEHRTFIFWHVYVEALPAGTCYTWRVAGPGQELDTATELPGLWVAGEDAGGVHGANRLGGNGVANSTVFGAIAGDTMADWIRHNPGHRPPDEDVLAAELERAQLPLARKGGDLNRLREILLDTMWDDVGVIRDKRGLERGLGKLGAIEAELLATGLADSDRAFNLTWADWLNLRSLVEISKAIAVAALKRENSRGAHYREDFPGEGDLATSTFTVARQRNGKLEIADEPVQFTIVPPGESLLKEAAE